MNKLSVMASTELRMFTMLHDNGRFKTSTLVRFVKQYGHQLRLFHLGGISHAKLDGETLLRVILDHCPHLISQGKWDLSGWGPISRDGFDYFLDKVGDSLKSFGASAHDVDGAARYLEGVATQCPNIESIDIPYSIDYSDLIVSSLSRMKNLRQVVLRDSSDEMYRALVPKLPQVEFSDWESKDTFISFTDPARKTFLD